MLHAILGHVRIWWNSAGPDASFTRRPLRPEGFVHHVSADRPLVHPTLQWVESEVLPYRQFSEPPLLEVEIDDPIIRDLVTPFVDHGSARDIYGHNASDISDYLR